MSTTERNPRVLAIDAGGTMTDTFIVDESGAFVVGKAQTTPENDADGFMASARDALRQRDCGPEEAFPRIVSGVFSGTAMVNRLFARAGLKVGVIVTAGQEDTLEMERGIQTYLGYSYGDRLHVATHYHNAPLVPFERVKGVRGRIDMFGEEVLPLRQQRRDPDRAGGAAPSPEGSRPSSRPLSSSRARVSFAPRTSIACRSPRP
jgi:N-methylhydantoinase A/acetone carboxylase beta subunit